MKSFDFSQLKMDCLNPVCIDGSALEHKGKALHFHNISELDAYISTLTAEMCQARKDNVKLIEPDYQEVQQSIPELIVWAESIKKHTMLFLDSSESSKNPVQHSSNADHKEISHIYLLTRSTLL